MLKQLFTINTNVRQVLIKLLAILQPLMTDMAQKQVHTRKHQQATMLTTNTVQKQEATNKPQTATIHMINTDTKQVVIKQTQTAQLQVMINMVVKLAHTKLPPTAQPPTTTGMAEKLGVIDKFISTAFATYMPLV